MDIENAILKLVTQTKKDLQGTTPDNLGNKDDPKRDIHGATQEGEKDKSF